MIRAIAALALLFAPLPAAAQEWYRVSVNADGAQYVDLASIQPDGHALRANEMAVFRTTLHDTPVKYAITTAQYDCEGKGMHFVRFEAFDAENKTLAALDDPQGGQFNTVHPGTPFGASLAFVCNTDRKNAVRVADPHTDSF